MSKGTLLTASVFLLIGVVVIYGTYETISKSGKEEVFTNISASDALNMIGKESNVQVIDVRNHDEIVENIPLLGNAVNVPVKMMQRQMEDLMPYMKKTVIIISRNGKDGEVASRILSLNGFMMVYNVIDGMAGIQNYQAVER